MSYPCNDEQYEDKVIAAVGDDGCSFTMDDGWSFYCPAESPVRPRVGAAARLYGRGIGFTVRGLYIDGVRAFYRDQAEDEEHHRQLVAKWDKEKVDVWNATGRVAYEAGKSALPQVFRRRLERFESNLPDFGKKYGAYELSCCTDGARIAAALKTPEAVKAFAKMPWAEQMKAVPGLFDGHSGNTFGMAVRLAHHYLTDPSLVWREHAAISALVGCEEAGCPPVNASAGKGGGDA